MVKSAGVCVLLVAAEGDGLIVAFNYRENKKAIISDELKQRILDVEKTIS